MELEGAGPGDSVLEQRELEDGARIAEVRPDRVLLVERLDRPGVRSRRSRQDEDGGEQDEKEAEAHG